MIDQRSSIVMLLAVSAVLSLADSESADEVVKESNCNEINTVLKQFVECFRSSNVTGYSSVMTELTESAVITRESFLAQITSTCSDGKLNEAYTRCTRDVISVCPELRETITDVVREKISFLCENNQPSSWIRGVLNGDYMLNTSCVYSPENDVIDNIRNCSQEVNSKLSGSVKKLNAPTVAEARDMFKRISSDWFQCTVSPYYGNTILPCGTKKKHVLLTYWIIFSIGGDPLRPPIGPEAMIKLTEIMSPFY
ncbi:uncharacterized protein LOC132731894 [Ruditapes philippinarum]|uniref:uncharacterized protein LOC132731894 n=1 Tax=Ruditapes philippinarum TaxID=129788 RepID=UPI00295BD7CD|nr:uncharacterized protein LOC132731894 [Ruditapes philippinarum]